MRIEETSSFGMGLIPSPIDVKDFKLAAYMPTNLGDLSGSKSWLFNAEPLDQWDKPHCGGFGCADFGINEPIQDNYTNLDGHRFYYLCKEIDGEPNAENGTTLRSVAKALRNEGRINSYAFAKTVDEIAYWLLNKGPVIVGTIWTVDMCASDKNNIIHPTGKVAGGHCYVINEIVDGILFGIQNSWGLRWGIDGKAYISKVDFQSLFLSGGEAIASVELPISSTVNIKENCFVLKLLGLIK